jgi:hypothetical protein
MTVSSSQRPSLGRGLFYTRDSGGEHETTPGEYVRWGQRKAAALGVRFCGTPEQIEAMIRDGRSQQGDLFLDYGIKGNQLQRPALDALFRLSRSDRDISHIFIPRRDRFARPDDPLDAMKMEASLREAGLTLVFMDKTLPPLPRGQRDLGEAIVAMIDYDRASQERRDLAQMTKIANDKILAIQQDAQQRANEVKSVYTETASAIASVNAANTPLVTLPSEGEIVAGEASAVVQDAIGQGEVDSLAPL